MLWGYSDTLIDLIGRYLYLYLYFIHLIGRYLYLCLYFIHLIGRYLYLYFVHLIGRMLDPQSELRPSATEILAYSEEKDLVDYERTQDNYEAQTLSCLFNQHSEPNNPPYPMSFESEESM